MIPLIQEPYELRHEFRGLLERCHFCNKPTDMWHHRTNNPVCPSCAKVHKVSELPDHGKQLRARARKAKRQ